eukprot:TRINITY_DN21400_c0_g1_i1.p1 TRINITY_DN21400_c0_g1~~TRINITY_DN21400_c0_g1_i1.p1  ORF type:complete len:385 (+),score=106.52 TRINITY_DN21400_c0_g1_i1:130-1284(+)
MLSARWSFTWAAEWCWFTCFGALCVTLIEWIAYDARDHHMAYVLLGALFGLTGAVHFAARIHDASPTHIQAMCDMPRRTAGLRNRFWLALIVALAEYPLLAQLHERKRMHIARQGFVENTVPLQCTAPGSIHINPNATSLQLEGAQWAVSSNYIMAGLIGDKHVYASSISSTVPGCTFDAPLLAVCTGMSPACLNHTFANVTTLIRWSRTQPLPGLSVSGSLYEFAPQSYTDLKGWSDKMDHKLHSAWYCAAMSWMCMSLVMALLMMPASALTLRNPPDVEMAKHVQMDDNADHDSSDDEVTAPLSPCTVRRRTSTWQEWCEHLMHAVACGVALLTSYTLDQFLAARGLDHVSSAGVTFAYLVLYASVWFCLGRALSRTLHSRQ